MHVKVYRKWFFKTIVDNQHVSDYGPFARADVKPQRIIPNSSGGAASSIRHCRATAVCGGPGAAATVLCAAGLLPILHTAAPSVIRTDIGKRCSGGACAATCRK